MKSGKPRVYDLSNTMMLWFDNPNAINMPNSTVRHFIYMAYVSTVPFSDSGPLRAPFMPEKLKRFNIFLRLLLLGTHPKLNTVIASDFTRKDDTDERQIDLFTKDMQLMYSEILETRFLFPLKPRKGLVYNMLFKLLELNKAYRRYTPTNYFREQVTVFLLAFSYMKVDHIHVIPKHDLMTLRSCLSLAKRYKVDGSENKTLSSFNQAYVSNEEPNYLNWFCGNVKRLFAAHAEFEDILNQMAFMSYFVALVRTRRMLNHLEDLGDKYNAIICGKLDDILKEMSTCIEASILVCSPERKTFTHKSVLLDFRGIKLPKKSPS